jgi:hypothetical protein
MAAYGLAEAMKEAEAVCDFAIKHKNAMAYCKATELRAKLSGLLIDRIEVVPVDLKGALEQARHRVVMVNAPPPCAEPVPDLAVTGGAHWTPHIPGNPPRDGVGANTATDLCAMVSQECGRKMLDERIGIAGVPTGVPPRIAKRHTETSTSAVTRWCFSRF